MPNRRIIPADDVSSSHTRGAPILASSAIGRAITSEIGIAARSASCLGTNSPTTTLKYVVSAITVTNATSPDISAGTPSAARRSPTGPSRLAPENAPVMIAIRVIPICTVERNLPGSAARASAVLALVEPSSARAFKRAVLAETIASSDMAKTPLSTISPAMINRSAQGNGVTPHALAQLQRLASRFVSAHPGSARSRQHSVTSH